MGRDGTRPKGEVDSVKTGYAQPAGRGDVWLRVRESNPLPADYEPAVHPVHFPAMTNYSFKRKKSSPVFTVFPGWQAGPLA